MPSVLLEIVLFMVAFRLFDEILLLMRVIFTLVLVLFAALGRVYFDVALLVWRVAITRLGAGVFLAASVGFFHVLLDGWALLHV